MVISMYRPTLRTTNTETRACLLLNIRNSHFCVCNMFIFILFNLKCFSQKAVKHLFYYTSVWSEYLSCSLVIDKQLLISPNVYIVYYSTYFHFTIKIYKGWAVQYIIQGTSTKYLFF